ncbi:unnamed protein product [Brugia timori]|uniref:Uncharacterized protein n=1 Tax=Brugia timori TaxID=42155 RepID=A0A3P7W1A2_9BILA|nr:unnamed protein product [Brugia timori]
MTGKNAITSAATDKSSVFNAYLPRPSISIPITVFVAAYKLCEVLSRYASGNVTRVRSNRQRRSTCKFPLPAIDAQRVNQSTKHIQASCNAGGKI